MDVILDSNIFRSDITLRSKEFDILMDYLKKTDSSLKLPQIIFDEIKGLYSKLLKERQLELNKTISNLNLVITDSTKHIDIPQISLDNELKEYENLIKMRFEISERNIIPYNNTFLPIISQRAIDRIKPAGEKGQGFRDTLIWLTMKDYCMKCPEKQIIFISNNTDDFANSDKITLHESLSHECKELNININYYKNLREFIENHSTKIQFITYDWLAENLDYELINDLVIEELNINERREIKSWIESETTSECEGYRALNIEPYNEEDLFVYEMLDNRLLINLTMKANIEFEFELYSRTYMYDNEYEYFTSSMTKNIKSNIYITATVIDQEIIDIEISDIDTFR